MEALTQNIAQFDCFPGTRYMGSKNRIIHEIWDAISELEFESFFDAFGGSNVVGYFMKCQGKKIITNDFMSLSYVVSKAIIENSDTILSEKEVKFLVSTKNKHSFIQDKFNGIYFDELENAFLDKVRNNIEEIKNDKKKSIALASLARACMKKRSRGIFTFVGERYNDGRSDMQKSLHNHFIESVTLFNNAVFENGFENKANNVSIEKLKVKADLVYFDPPYFTPNSDNDYTRRYHFVEGLVKNWEGLEIQESTITKKFKSYQTPFSKRQTTYDAFDQLFKQHQKSIIVISYSSNSFPDKEELYDMLNKYKKNVEVIEIDLTYSFGNQNHKIGNNANKVKEYLFIGK